MSFTRREALAYMAAAAAPAVEPPRVDPLLVERHDAVVARYLAAQNVDAKSPFQGGVADGYGLYAPGTCSGIISAYACAYMTPGSKYHKSDLLIERMKLANLFLRQSQ